MNLKEDSFEFSNKPKKGRRANALQSSVELDNLDHEVPIVSKKSGWADDTLKSAKNRSSINLIEQQRFQEQSPVDIGDNIPIVPEIEEIHDEGCENVTDVARAPATSVSSTTTYKELLHKSSHVLPQLDQMAVDLSFLTRHMYSQELVQQPDEPWTRDSLFQQLVTNSNYVTSDYTA